MEIPATRISVLIPVFGREDVFTTVTFLRSMPYARILHFVVVDNGNETTLSERLQTLAGADCVVLRLDTNRGGAGAFRAAMFWTLEEHKSDFVWLLDDDAIVNAQTLPALLTEYERLEHQGVKVGALGSMMLGRFAPRRIIELGAEISPWTGRMKQVFKNLTIDDVVLQVREVDYVAAASLLVRYSVFQSIGPFEDVFIHWDDIDWQFRLKKLGFRNFATSRSIVNHLECKAKISDWLWYYDNRNPVWFLMRHMPWLVPVSVALRIARAGWIALKGRRYAAKLTLLGIYHAFTGRVLLRDELPPA